MSSRRNTDLFKWESMVSDDGYCIIIQLIQSLEIKAETLVVLKNSIHF